MTAEPTCQRRVGGSVRGPSGAIGPAQERDLIFVFCFSFLIYRFVYKLVNCISRVLDVHLRWFNLHYAL
jgi:hypothetical protein